MLTFSRRYEFPAVDHIFRDPAAHFWKTWYFAAQTRSIASYEVIWT